MAGKISLVFGQIEPSTPKKPEKIASDGIAILLRRQRMTLLARLNRPHQKSLKNSPQTVSPLYSAASERLPGWVAPSTPIKPAIFASDSIATLLHLPHHLAACRVSGSTRSRAPPTGKSATQCHRVPTQATLVRPDKAHAPSRRLYDSGDNADPAQTLSDSRSCHNSRLESWLKKP
jgi:hypothetical protein